MKDTEDGYFNFLELLWAKKYLIVISGLSSALLFYLLSFSANIVFESKAILKIRNSSETNTRDFSALGNISNFVGIDFGTEDSKKSEFSLAILKSRDFFDIFYKDETFLISMFATNGFNEDLTSTFDSTVYDKNDQIWKKTFRNGKNFPGFEESYEYFHSKIFKIELDRKTNFFYLTVETPNPKLSKDTLDTIIKQLNNYVREKDLKESKSSVDYLDNYLLNNNSMEIKESVINLMENEIKTQMYANIQEEYLLEQIENPRIILEKSNPKRSIWVIFGFVFGLILSFLAIIYGKILKSHKS